MTVMVGALLRKWLTGGDSRISNSLLNDPRLDWLENLSDWEVCFPILPWDVEDPDWEMDCQDCHDVLAYLDLTGNLDAPLW